MKTIAEINQQNEEFINKIIGESAFNNGDEHIDVEDIENTCDIPDSDPADPTVCELVVTLACGETLKMAFTSQVMDSLLGQSKEIKDMVNQLHEMCAYIYADEQLDTIENIIKDIMSNEDLAIPMEKYDCIEDRKLRMMFMLHDATHIYTSISHVISEKDLMDSVFKSVFNTSNFNVEDEENEDNSTEDNNSEQTDTTEA